MPLRINARIQVLAQRGQPLRVAQRMGRVDRQLALQERLGQDRAEERVDQLRLLVPDHRGRVVVVRVLAVVGRPELPRDPLLPVLTSTPVPPLSNLVPPGALSNLCTGNSDRTPAA